MTPELHPRMQAFLERRSSLGNPTPEALSIAGTRELQDEYYLSRDREPEPVQAVHTFSIDGFDEPVRVRLYVPEGEPPFPGLVWLHGGGFIHGDLETADGVCRALTAETGCVVTSVEYRLAPEHPFPAGVKDCYAATKWVLDHPEVAGVDPDRVAIGGESAGGTLTAATTQMARDLDGPELAHQVLVYAGTNPYPFPYAEEMPSYEERGTGYVPTLTEMDRARNLYVEDAVAGRHPYAFPLQASDFSNLPSATVITAEFDPLRDECRRYGERLADAGTEVTVRNFEDVTHGFFTMLDFERAEEARALVAAELDRVL